MNQAVFLRLRLTRAQEFYNRYLTLFMNIFYVPRIISFITWSSKTKSVSLRGLKLKKNANEGGAGAKIDN